MKIDKAYMIIMDIGLILMAVKRNYYVKLDNICVEDITLLGFKHMMASSGPELLQNAIAFYGFGEECSAHLQLWSSPHRLSASTVRLDTMPIIPEEYEFVWVRGFKCMNSTFNPLPELADV